VERWTGQSLYLTTFLVDCDEQRRRAASSCPPLQPRHQLPDCRLRRTFGEQDDSTDLSALDTTRQTGGAMCSFHPNHQLLTDQSRKRYTLGRHGFSLPSAGSGLFASRALEKHQRRHSCGGGGGQDSNAQQTPPPRT
jgi:hypothetical protein